MIQRTFIALWLVCAAGCATNLQKADRLMRLGRFADARRFYQTELDQQRRLAELPRWTGREYQDQFNALNSSRAILGVGNSHKDEGRRDAALYHYSYFIQFSLRHRLDSDREIKAIEEWIRDSGIAAPATEVGLRTLFPSTKRVSTSAAVSPDFKADPPPVPPKTVVRPQKPEKKASTPAASQKLARSIDREDEKPKKTTDEYDNADSFVNW